MNSQDDRKDSYQKRKRLPNGHTFELLLVLCGFVTWIGVEKFNWNVIATFVITLIIAMILFYTSLNQLLNLIFSIAWGIVGFQLFHYLVSVTGGGSTLSYLIGIIGFILGLLISYGTRSLGKQYNHNIEIDI